LARVSGDGFQYFFEERAKIEMACGRAVLVAVGRVCWYVGKVVGPYKFQNFPLRLVSEKAQNIIKNTHLLNMQIVFFRLLEIIDFLALFTQILDEL